MSRMKSRAVDLGLLRDGDIKAYLKLMGGLSDAARRVAYSLLARAPAQDLVDEFIRQQGGSPDLCGKDSPVLAEAHLMYEDAVAELAEALRRLAGRRTAGRRRRTRRKQRSQRPPQAHRRQTHS